jgi:hypothetical protein
MGCGRAVGWVSQAEMAVGQARGPKPTQYCAVISSDFPFLIIIPKISINF